MYIVVHVNVDFPGGRHMPDANETIAILIGIRASMLVVMIVVYHCLMKHEAWGAATRGFAHRSSVENRKLCQKNNQKKGKHKPLEHFNLL